MDDQQQQMPPAPPEAAPPPPTAPPVSSWQAPAPTPVPGAAGFIYADVPNRIFALIIDAIVLVIISLVVGIVLAAVGLSTGGFFSNAGLGLGLLVYAVIGFVINAAYFIYSWTTMRATLGMKALGMQVGNAFDGKTLTMEQAVRRAIALWGPTTVAQFFNSISGIGALLSLLAFLWVLYLLYTTATSPTKQGFHDKFANTVVVKAGRMV
jgi:uncharacterized RDD family membrane protein YckC